MKMESDYPLSELVYQRRDIPAVRIRMTDINEKTDILIFRKRNKIGIVRNKAVVEAETDN